MKPICIRMQQFGVYTEKVSLDFSKLNFQNIFLITGSTGGGKTTILDAMSFALYCKASGGLRTFKSMRNISAKDSDATIVDFTFSLDNQIYRFMRTYKIHYIRGSHEKRDKYEHECYKQKDNEWVLLESGSESKVREFAEKLIGLDHEQFSKVILLPQGEFRNLLLAKPIQKAQIFQKLFMTEKWNKITDSALGFSKKLKEDLDIINTRIITLLSSNEVESLEDLLFKKKNLEHNIENCKKDLSHLDKDLEIIIQKVEKVNKITEFKKSIEKNVDKQKNIESCLHKANCQFLKIEEEKKNLPSYQEKAKKLLTDLNRHELIFKLLNEANEINTQLEILKKDLELLKENKNNLTISYESNDNKIKNMETFLKTTYLKMNDFPVLFEKRDKLNLIIDKYAELETFNIKYQKKKEQHNGLKHELAKVSVSRCSLKNSLENIEENTKRNLTSALAMSLKEGEPCPVCGSKIHPAPANYCEDLNISEAQKMELLKENLEKITSEFESLNAKSSLLELELKDLENEILLIKDEYETLPYNNQQARIKLDELNNEIEKLFNIRNELDTYNYKLNVLKDRQTEISKLLEESQNNINIKDKKIAVLNAKKNAILSKLNEQEFSIVDIKNKINETKCILENNERRISYIQNSYARLLSEVEKEKSNLKNINEVLQKDRELFLNLIEDDTIEIEKSEYYIEEQNRISLLIKEKNITLGNLQQQAKSIDLALQSLSKLNEEREKVQNKYSDISKIAFIMAGKNPLKMPIRMYVLGMILDDILSFANIYFSRLSNSRYGLSRVTDKVVISNGQNGLSIEIFDAYYGATRPIDTLSGGELFLASLSLALGLSDVVQCHAGSIHIDSLFIDEGFGSLDNSTLDTAISALNKIQKMGRIVGIISHVDELKTRIPSKVEVYKSDNGIQKIKVNV